MPGKRHALLRLLKTAAPPPRHLWRARRALVGGLAALILVAVVGDIARFWILELKDLLIPLVVALASLAWSVTVWLCRVALERRPGPTERQDAVRAMGQLIFEPAGAGAPGTRTLRRFRPKTDREIRTADTRALVEAMTLMNCRLFERSVHGQGFADKLARNLSHLDKNPRCIRLLGLSDEGRRRQAASLADSRPPANAVEALPWIGFSHILPLTASAMEAYLRRGESEPGVEDVALDGRYVCRQGEPAAAFLIFTIALDARQVKRWEPPLAEGLWARLRQLIRDQRLHANRIRQAEQALYVMAFEHLMELAHYHLGARRDAQVLAQAFAPSSARTLRSLGFNALNDVRTADEEPLYALQVRFP